jgi:L-ribulose-5-phosphate 3-epimerase
MEYGQVQSPRREKLVRIREQAVSYELRASSEERQALGYRQRAMNLRSGVAFILGSLLLFTLLLPVLTQGQEQNKRYKIALIDLMLLKRQKLGALQLTKDLGADGVEVDMGGLGKRPTFDNQLLNDTVRQSYLNKIKELNIEIPSLAMTGYYAQSFCEREEYKQSIADCIKTMQLMNVKIAFLPMGVQCDLVKNPDLRSKVVERLKEAGKMAQAAGVVIGIETPLSAAAQVKLLDEIGSPAIKIYFNVADALGAGRDVYDELRILGRRRICQIHCTNKDGVWLENDPEVDMKKIKQTLDKMKWSGWLVVERSRDAKQPTNVKANYGANTKYLKSIFQTE